MDLPFRIEYARSGESFCRICDGFIEARSLRLGIMKPSGEFDRNIPAWRHVDCLFRARPDDAPVSIRDIAYFENILVKDQKIIANLTGEDTGEPVAKKPRADSREEIRVAQNEKMYNLKKQLYLLSKSKLETLLTKNGQILSNSSQITDLVDLLSDQMAFGAFKGCKCGKNMIRFNRSMLRFNQSTGYICKNFVFEHVTCGKVVQSPERKIFIVPDKLKKKYSFLNNYKSTICERIFSRTIEEAVEYEKSSVYNRKTASNGAVTSNSNVPKMEKRHIKGGTTLFPKSGLEDIAHVYEENNEKYSVTLNNAMLQFDLNAYYRMQILKEDDAETYYLFICYGRNGTDRGKKLLEKMNRESCIKKLKEKFKEKTGNDWSNRDNFVQKNGKYRIVDINDNNDIKKEEFLQSTITSKLSQSVQDLMELIFDKKIMDMVMKEYELDVELLPSGLLTKKAFEEANRVLSKLYRIIKHNNTNEKKLEIEHETTRFYNIIPHGGELSLLDTVPLLDAKREMVASLADMVINCKIVHDTKSGEQNLFDAYYRKLKVNIEVLDKASEDFAIIKKYFKNTHGNGKRTKYNLEIEEVFVVQRPGEKEAYDRFKNYPNKKLLWHGSRTTNFARILLEGLRIAPPEAPSSGDRFGKGLYFADMVAKSAKYCRIEPENPTGLLMLCEVALGNMYKRHRGKSSGKLAEGKHSMFGIGKLCPDPTDVTKINDGVEVPYGKPVKNQLVKPYTQHNYNEYVVYDVAQVQAQYLVRFKSKY